MINYLKGKIIEIVKNTNNRIILILEVNEIGYEIQIPSRLARQLSTDNLETLQIFTHLQIHEDRQTLYGFASAAERDLFRQLISVSGIGTQLAIALIDTLGLEELVQAIVTGNLKTLSKTPGVGVKTAERIALELKTKLAQWRQIVGVTVSTSSAIPSAEIIEDVEMTLLALGYTNEEINQALSAISQDNQLLKNRQVEEWIRSAIAWLSNESS
ncbi:Holliday junction branch migration protein RuvA [Candidatus Gracilibacteria bacterium]|nr:Holliday junction branch migration protein RuvA [Candidatus Gracilibacteria bacterium]NJM87648.1 Holliday junction branch migration protein RuvA [Hydrococcus sp. RU_2_2]NJP20949.1 Holliday junction branch migration protein RuvA [Hydrococcus sp. CRU_1_1]NJQ97543.1 Holliday junction branch migration protein RuvA [Hydrococcus sp. CSU_1_8]